MCQAASPGRFSTLCLRNAACVSPYAKALFRRCLESADSSVTAAVTGRGDLINLFILILYEKCACYWPRSSLFLFPQMMNLHTPPASYCTCFHSRLRTSLQTEGRKGRKGGGEKRRGGVFMCVFEQVKLALWRGRGKGGRREKWDG